MFLSPDASASRFILFLLLLPLAGLGLFSPTRRYPVDSAIFWACATYLAALVVASAVQQDVALDQIWRQFRYSVLVLLFLWITAYLVFTYPKFLTQLFLTLGVVVALSAAINVGFFLASASFDGPIEFYRLKAVLGMPGYENSTNISATYAVFFVGIAATIWKGDMSPLARRVLSLAGGALLAGVLLTQARSALVAVLAGLTVMALIASPRARWFAAFAALLVAMLAVSVPTVSEAILARGTSYRLEVWEKFAALIVDRPLTGYGYFSTVQIEVGNKIFLNQAHNLVLSAWFRGGVVSAVAMAFILLGGIYWAARYWITMRQVTPLCVIVTMTTAGMLDYQLVPTYPAWEWVTFWLPIGLCIGAELAVRGARKSEIAGFGTTFPDEKRQSTSAKAPEAAQGNFEGAAE